MIQLTTQQEEVMLEEGRERDFERKIAQGLIKCEFCNTWVSVEEIQKVKVDECSVKICECCLEELQNTNEEYEN